MINEDWKIICGSSGVVNLSPRAKKKKISYLRNLTLFYLELGWWLRDKWPVKIFNTKYLGWNLIFIDGFPLSYIEGDFLDQKINLK